MKRMLLVSMFQNVANVLKHMEGDVKSKTITYIPTASAVERLGFFTNIGKRKLRKLGFIIDVLDVSTASYESIKDTLEKNDCIYIAGGNTFFLLQELRRTGADALLVDAINNGKFYIGESAGAIVVAPSIAYSSAMDDPGKAPGLQDYAGLNLVDFYVVPHQKNWELGKAADKIISEYAHTLSLKVISDNQAIFVQDDKATILDR